MKIVKLVAENFKKLVAIEIVPTGNVIEITGKCEQGKTTILDAIMTALCGTKWDEPLRQGTEKGYIKVDLGDMIVTRTFTKAGGGTLKVETKDGAKYPSPQTLLDKLVGKIAFDPLLFSKEKDPKKQVEMLLKVVDIKIDHVKLQEISGVKIEASPNPLDMLNAAYKSVYEDRTATNRQLDAANKILESLPKVEKVEAVLLTELVAKKEALQAQIKRNEEQRLDVESQRLFLVNTEAAKTKVSNEITELENQLIAKRETLKNLTLVAEEADNEHKRLQLIADKLVDPDLTAINLKISTADTTNRQAQQYANRETKQADVNKYQTDSDNYTAKLKKIVDYKTEIVSKAKFPVPGLDFAGGGVTFEGKPFSQASSAQKMRVGIGIGMAGNPELRVIMLDGYESLDSDQRKIVEEMAQEHDFQVWTTAVSDQGVGIYIEDGEIKTAEVAG